MISVIFVFKYVDTEVNCTYTHVITVSFIKRFFNVNVNNLILDGVYSLLTKSRTFEHLLILE